MKHLLTAGLVALLAFPALAESQAKASHGYPIDPVPTAYAVK